MRRGAIARTVFAVGRQDKRLLPRWKIFVGYESRVPADYPGSLWLIWQPRFCRQQALLRTRVGQIRAAIIVDNSIWLSRHEKKTPLDPNSKRDGCLCFDNPRVRFTRKIVKIRTRVETLKEIFFLFSWLELAWYWRLEFSLHNDPLKLTSRYFFFPYHLIELGTSGLNDEMKFLNFCRLTLMFEVW